MLFTLIWMGKCISWADLLAESHIMVFSQGIRVKRHKIFFAQVGLVWFWSPIVMSSHRFFITTVIFLCTFVSLGTLHWWIVGLLSYSWLSVPGHLCHIVHSLLLSFTQFCSLQGKTRQMSASDTSKNGSLILIGSPCSSFSISQMVEEGSVYVCA